MSVSPSPPPSLSPPSLPLSLFPQTNVYAKAQYRKMGYFNGFVRKAVVVIPPHHELRKRTAMRAKEMGDPVPEDALNAMRGEREGGGSEGCDA